MGQYQNEKLGYYFLFYPYEAEVDGQQNTYNISVELWQLSGEEKKKKARNLQVDEGKWLVQPTYS